MKVLEFTSQKDDYCVRFYCIPTYSIPPVTIMAPTYPDEPLISLEVVRDATGVDTNLGPCLREGQLKLKMDGKEKSYWCFLLPDILLYSTSKSKSCTQYEVQVCIGAIQMKGDV